MNLPILQNQLANASGALNALSGLGNAAKNAVSGDAVAGTGEIDFAALLEGGQIAPELAGFEITQTATQNFDISLGGNTLASLNLGDGEVPSLEKLSAILENLSGALDLQATSSIAGAGTEVDAEALAGLAEGLLNLVNSLTAETTTAQSGPAKATAQAELTQTLAAAKAFVGNLEKLTSGPNAQISGELGTDFKAMIENVSERLAKIDPNLPIKEQLKQTTEELALIKDALTQAAPKTATTTAEAEALLRTQTQAKHADLAQKNGFDAGGTATQKVAGDPTPSAQSSPASPASPATPAPAAPPTANANTAANPALTAQNDGLQLVQTGSSGQTPEQLTLQQSQQTQTPGQFAATLKSAQDASAGQKINLPAMAVAITQQVAQGNPRFQIRLDPPELGRIDVRMETDSNGVMNARLSVERPETLEMLARDARALERALQQANGDGQKPNLEFTLKQDGADHNSDGDDQSESGLSNQNLAAGSPQDAENAQNAEITHSYRGFAQPGGLNLMV